jgi:hypothetical protein
MAATWTTPATWANSVLVDATQLNTHIRDNMDYLFTRPRSVNTVNAAADYTTSSTSFVDVDGTGALTDFTLSVTTTGGRLLVGFAGTINNAGGNTTYRGYLDVEIDGVRIGLDDGLFNFGYSTSVFPCSFVAMTDVLSVGTHTVKLQWKTNNAANVLTCYAGAGTGSADVHPRFWALEV